MELNIIKEGDTTWFKHKKINGLVEMDYLKTSEILTIKPSKIQLEHASFNGEGTVNIKDDYNVDLKLHGEKENFDILIAFAPEELIPVLEKYDNQENITFEASIIGKTVKGNTPHISVDFSCRKTLMDEYITRMNI